MWIALEHAARIVTEEIAFAPLNINPNFTPQYPPWVGRARTITLCTECARVVSEMF
jgi:hypothetical protein